MDFTAACAEAKGDGARPNVVRLVYAVLVASPEPMSSGEIVRQTGALLKSVQSALCRLKKDNLVIKYGTADWNTKWSAASRRKRGLPERRGKSPGSQKALRMYGGCDGVPVAHRNFAALKNVKTVNGKLLPKPKPTTALEQAWVSSASPAFPQLTAMSDKTILMVMGSEGPYIYRIVIKGRASGFFYGR